MLIKKPNPNEYDELWVGTYDGDTGPFDLFTDQVEWYECKSCDKDFFVERSEGTPIHCPFCGTK